MQIKGRTCLHSDLGHALLSHLFLCEQREGAGTQVAAPLGAFELFLKFGVFLEF